MRKNLTLFFKTQWLNVEFDAVKFSVSLDEIHARFDRHENLGCGLSPNLFSRLSERLRRAS